MYLDAIPTTRNHASSTRSGIGRRRGSPSKSPITSVVVVAASFFLTALILILIYSTFLSPTTTPTRIRGDRYHVNNANVGDKIDESMSKQFSKYREVLTGELDLVGLQTSGMRSNNEHSYQGVKARFCKLDWDQYKNNPPSLPMHKSLVSASGCDDPKNIVTMDLLTVVQKAREIDKVRDIRDVHNDGDVHVMPPTGFVFHESRVGSTLVANSLAAMDPKGHRVYSESHPINEALKACDGVASSRCDMDTNIDLFRDVVYLMGRTAFPLEKRMFFKVSSIGSKRINVMRKAFPSVPWIFVYRDPVQTMMSQLDPAKQSIRGGPPQGPCLRSKKSPPEDLVQLVKSHDEDVNRLSYEEFCAAHLATLCESALRQMKKSDGKGITVEYDGLVEKLIQNVIPNHFGVEVDEEARQRILDVSTVYSKSKNGSNKDWVEDSARKEVGSTPEIRSASELFLSQSYAELKKYSVQ